MRSRASRRRRTAELVDLAQQRFYGCSVCRRDDSLDFAEDVLGALQLLKHEYSRLFRALTCPACDSRVSPGTLILAATREQIWHNAQSAKFDKLYKRELEDFRAFLIAHPFLGLQHRFGRSLAKAVRSAKRMGLQPDSWYRVSANVEKPSFDPLPPDKTINAYRFNFIGQAAWYLGCDARTSAVEVLREPRPKAPFAVASVRIGETLDVLDLRQGLWGENPVGNWILREVVHRRFTSEPTNDVDESRPQYRVPQYIADLARSCKFRGLLYDSTRPSAYNNPEAAGYNLVLFDPWPRYEITQNQLMEFGESDGEGIGVDRWPLVCLRDGPIR
jgi:hypothetical protein